VWGEMDDVCVSLTQVFHVSLISGGSHTHNVCARVCVFKWRDIRGKPASEFLRSHISHKLNKHIGAFG